MSCPKWVGRYCADSVTRCWNKEWPNFSKSYPKICHNLTFTWKVMLLKWPKKSPYIWASVLIKFVTKHFLKNRPIWSHCCQGNCLNQRDLRSKLGFSKCWVGFVFAMKISFVLSFYLFSLSLSLNLKFDSKLKNSFECYTLRRRSSKPSSSNQVLICRPSWCLKTMFKVGAVVSVAQLAEQLPPIP